MRAIEYIYNNPDLQNYGTYLQLARINTVDVPDWFHAGHYISVSYSAPLLYDLQ